MAQLLHAILLLLLRPIHAEARASTWVNWLRGAAGWDAASVAAQSTLTDASRWAPLVSLLQGWEFTSNYAVSVGDVTHGRLFVYEGGNFTMKTQIPTGSTSKWPSAMMFAGLVADGTISSLDDPVYKYVSWWTQDPKDLRSTVTFRMLLTFTSGFGDGHPGQEANTRAGREWRLSHSAPRAPAGLHERLVLELGPNKSAPCDKNTGDTTECAKLIYSKVKLIGKPGEVYSYNENHLNLAAAVSVAATGMSIHEVIDKYLLKPFGMTHTYYSGACPDFGSSLVTTGDDYERFLTGLLSYNVLNKSLVEESEKDATPFLSDDYTLYGNYGFGHFLMCFDSVDGMTTKCREDRCHMDPGAFGFIPLYDRKNGFYFQVVAAETGATGSYPLSGIPEYLAVAIKPHVDAIMSATPPDPSEHMSHSPSLLSLAVADVNYCLNCVLHPDQCT